MVAGMSDSSTKARPGPQGLAAKPSAITQRRTERGLSVTDLSRLTGLSHGHISNVERCRRRVSPRHAAVIAAALDADMADLFQI